MRKKPPRHKPPRKKHRLRSTLLTLLTLTSLYLITAWFGGCAAPVAGLWPPPADAPADAITHRIVVSVDSWHSVIGLFPLDDPGGVDMSRLEEWSYADRRYYLDGDTGCSGTMNAMFWPSDGIVQVARLGAPWSERTPQPPARLWSFELTVEGRQAIEAHLHAERSSTEPIRVGRSTWYPATHDYHAFHQCHHWTARALRSAGLPVWSFYAPFKWTLEAQLDRALTFVAE